MEWILMVAVLLVGLSFGYWAGRRTKPTRAHPGGVPPDIHPVGGRQPEMDEKKMTEHDTYGA